ncbi:zinc finger C2H2 domain-containing protein [Vairimorpha necatrix]|uniref:Zinc finger C2H2 domain-containing protein n=1 Tax=Vairimorpha necatrix TaxID=6039 RepID=A0AAX4JAQ7_9MICR
MTTQNIKKIQKENFMNKEFSKKTSNENMTTKHTIVEYSQPNYSDNGFAIPPKKLIESLCCCKKCGCGPDVDLIRIFLLSAYSNNYLMFENYKKSQLELKRNLKLEENKLKKENEKTNEIVEDLKNIQIEETKEIIEEVNLIIKEAKERGNTIKNEKKEVKIENEITYEIEMKVEDKIEIKMENKVEETIEEKKNEETEIKEIENAFEETKPVYLEDFGTEKEELDEILEKETLKGEIAVEKLVKGESADEKLVKGEIADEKILKEQVVDEKILKEQIVEEKIMKEEIVDEKMVKGEIIDEKTMKEEIVEQELAQEVFVEQESEDDETIPSRQIIRKSAYNSLVSQNLINMIPLINKNQRNRKNLKQNVDFIYDESKKRRKSSFRYYDASFNNSSSMYPSTNEFELNSSARKNSKFHKCNFCETEFFSKVKHNQHVKTQHPDELPSIIKPFCCPFENCQNSYKNKNGIEYHLIHKHSIVGKNLQKMVAKITNEE